MSYEKNGIVYDRKNNAAVTIKENGDKPEKFPPHLFLGRVFKNVEPDIKEDAQNSSFSISTKKINEHLKKINRKIESPNIQIKIEKKKKVTARIYLLGIDDVGNSYVLSDYSGWPAPNSWKEVYVMVFSQQGQKLAEVPIDPDFFDKETFENELALDINGNFFQMWASENGIHIFKWIKN